VTTTSHAASLSHGWPAAPGPRSWPEIPPASAGTVRALAARALVKAIAARLPIRIQTPDGRLTGAGGPGSPVLEIRHQDEFYRRLDPAADPPLLPVRVAAEAASLRDGRAVLALPGGLRWVAQHGPVS
jgi:hypothetical protein